MKTILFYELISLLLISCVNHKGYKNDKSEEIDLLHQLESPILIEGTDHMAFRDPLIIYEYGLFWLFYSTATNKTDSIIQGKAFWQTAYSNSTDLKNWTQPVAITPENLSLNFCSPGSITKNDDEWILSLQTYPTPNGEKFGNDSSRLWIMRSNDLKTWSEPELIYFMGRKVAMEDMPRMIDPYLMKDKGDAQKWLCFCKVKQTGVSMSWSNDLKEWHYQGRIDGGENACVIVVEDEYILFHSPENGIGIKHSKDLTNWKDDGILFLDQKKWEWAQGRLTAGYVMDARQIRGINKYIMVFHGEKNKESFTHNASIGIAWSDDLTNWEWPK